MVDRQKYLSTSEVKQLRTVTEAAAIVDSRKGKKKGPRTWLLVDLALCTGLRVGEIARLRIEDVDYKRSSLTVTRTKRRKRTTETLAISSELAQHLKEYCWDRNKGPLFVGERGPLTIQGLQQIWKRAVQQSGLPTISIHSARHTIAVHLLKKTNNLRQVQKQLGHTSPVVTANMYADVAFEDMQKGVTALYA